MSLLCIVTQAFLFCLPAYIATTTAAISVNPPRFLAGISLLTFRLPCSSIDGGRNLGGNRLFGDGKTVRGSLVGLAGGCVIGVLLYCFGFFPPSAESWAFSFLLPAGAISGDIGGSFLKRRLGLAQGEPVPVLDQLDFLIGAFAFAILFTRWFDLEVLVTGILLTPPIHLAGNRIAYESGVKSEPY